MICLKSILLKCDFNFPLLVLTFIYFHVWWRKYFFSVHLKAFVVFFSPPIFAPNFLFYVQFWVLFCPSTKVFIYKCSRILRNLESSVGTIISFVINQNYPQIFFFVISVDFRLPFLLRYAKSVFHSINLLHNHEVYCFCFFHLLVSCSLKILLLIVCNEHIAMIYDYKLVLVLYRAETMSILNKT